MNTCSEKNQEKFCDKVSFVWTILEIFWNFPEQLFVEQLWMSVLLVNQPLWRVITGIDEFSYVSISDCFCLLNSEAKKNMDLHRYPTSSYFICC